MGFVLISINFAVGPQIARLYAQGEQRQLQRMVRTAAHWIFWPSLLACAGLVLLSSMILGFFGPEFLAGQPLLYVLVIGQVVNAATGPVAVMLNMTGYQDHTARVYGWSLLFKIGLSAIAIPLGGAMGMAILTAGIVALQNIWLWGLTLKHLRLDASILGLKRTHGE